MDEAAEAPRHTCLKLEIPGEQTDPIFVKGTWFPSRFNLSITDGHHAWFCDATEEDVEERAAQWDQPVSEYIQLAEKHLGFQHSGSVYRFADAGDGHKRLSWTFEKEGTKLEWRWKCKPSPDCKKTTARILDFLMDSNIRLSEEVVRKTRSFERLKEEAEKCLEQSEKLNSEKMEFESAIYAKFVAVLNSKKRKLRELRDQLSKKESAKLAKEEEEESTDKTERFDEPSDGENSNEKSPGKFTGTSKGVSPTKGRVRKRVSR